MSEEVPEIRRYTVEVIVFKYAQDVSSGQRDLSARRSRSSDDCRA